MIGAKNRVCGELSKSTQIFPLVAAARDLSVFADVGLGQMPLPAFRASYRNASVDSLAEGNRLSQHDFQTLRPARDSDSGYRRLRQQVKGSLLEQSVSAGNVRAADTWAATKFPLPPFLSPENLLRCIPDSHRPFEGGEASGSGPGS